VNTEQNLSSACHPNNGWTSVYLIRHGQTEGNAKHLFIGSTDLPLDDVGQRQALALGKRLAKTHFDAVISSPLRRARQTANRISHFSGTALSIHPGFTEIDFGELEGKTIEWFETHHRDLASIHATPASNGVAWPRGESRSDFNDRVIRSFSDTLCKYNRHTIAVVCHGGVIGSILSHIQGGLPNDWVKFAVQNCSITHLEIDHTQTRFHMLNDYHHLNEVQKNLFALNPIAYQSGK